MTSLHLSTHLRSDIINDYVFTQRWPVSMLTTGFKAVSFEIPITIAQNAIQFTPWMESIQIAFARMFIHHTVWNVWEWERDRWLFFYLWLFYTDLKKSHLTLSHSHMYHTVRWTNIHERKKNNAHRAIHLNKWHWFKANYSLTIQNETFNMESIVF